MKAAVLGLPGETGIELANWNWRAVRHFVLKRFGIGLSRSTCLTPNPPNESVELAS